ncbi:MAG: hypothetical protein R2941_01240 [Desulfobacterales bacterium]
MMDKKSRRFYGLVVGPVHMLNIIVMCFGEHGVKPIISASALAFLALDLPAVRLALSAA